MDKVTAKQQRLYSFIENIACIADKKYQERVWVRNEGPECDDIDDTICDFFDDGDPILEKYEDFGITKTQYNLLVILREKLNKFIDTFGIFSPMQSTEKLIRLPQWQEIREISKKVLKAFNYQSKNENVNKNIEFFIDELSSAVNEKVLNQSKEISWPMVFQESTVSIKKLIDNCEYVLSRKEDFQLEEKQYALIKELYNLLLDFSKEYFDIPEEKEKNPKWKKIVEVGKKILKTFHK